MPPAEERVRARPTTWKALEPTEEEREELLASQPKRESKGDEQDEPGDMAFAPDLELSHGDVIEGGTWTIEAIHTPGHISNHLCFGLREEQSLFSGDHVMGWSTSVVPSPEGSMSDYMVSLDLLLERDDEWFYPTHGSPVPDPQAFTRALIAHRQDRERQIEACLASGPKTIPEMVTAMYQATPHILHMAAGQSVFSHLLSMHEAEMVATDDPAPHRRLGLQNRPLSSARARRRREGPPRSTPVQSPAARSSGAAPLTITGVLLTALGIPWWLSAAAMVAMLAILVLEIDL